VLDPVEDVAYLQATSLLGGPFLPVSLNLPPPMREESGTTELFLMTEQPKYDSMSCMNPPKLRRPFRLQPLPLGPRIDHPLYSLDFQFFHSGFDSLFEEELISRSLELLGPLEGREAL